MIAKRESKPGRNASLAMAFLAAAIILSHTAEAQETIAQPGRMVTLPDGRKLNFRCSGVGAPTILLEAGYAADSLAWPRVRPVLARRNRTCAYDRAGYGLSDPGPFPRDGAAVALDLDHALRSAGITGPFVLVGHSAGGLYVRLFADRRPHDVVGMVLVDPSVEFQDRRMAAIFGPGAGALTSLRDRDARCLAAAQLPASDPGRHLCVGAPGPDTAVNAARLAEAARASMWRTRISELDSLWTRTSEEVASGMASYGEMPLIVLTADGTYATAPAIARPALDAFWTGVHREIAARSTRGEERRVVGSSHLMMFDRPDAIIDAVNTVIAAGRRRNAQ